MVATTDPLTLPDLTTFYLVTNLPLPATQRAQASRLAAADLAEVVRLYGLRMWVEQSYKQVKHTLGWSQYQVRSDQAIRRHWQLVCCAFSFCWYHASHPTESRKSIASQEDSPAVSAPPCTPRVAAGTGKKNQHPTSSAATAVLASGIASRQGVVGAVDHAQALLEWLVGTAPTSCLATVVPVA